MKNQKSVIYIHSIIFNGNVEGLSAYKVGFVVPSISFHIKREYNLKKSIKIGKESKFVIRSVYPYNIDLFLTFRKGFSQTVSIPFQMKIESSHFNYIGSSGQIRLNYIFKKDVSATITYYIMTENENPLKLIRFQPFQISVFSAQLKENVFLIDEETVAKKIIMKRFDENYMREILPFFELDRHNCIIGLKAYSNFENDFYLILERFGESLDDHIKRRDLYSYNIIKIIVCVCCGLIHMHQHNYIHRDIKPGNIVVDRSGNAKLIDFGISRQFERDELTEDVGTMRYIAPEVFEGDYDFRCDIYSLGVVILEMISDVSVTDFLNGKDLVDTPNITQVILRSILSPDPLERPTLDEILSFIRAGIFYLVPDVRNSNEKSNEQYLKSVNEEIQILYNKNYAKVISGIRNDFSHLLMNEDSFVFHFGMFLFLKNEKNRACDIFFLGYLLGDIFCTFMVEAMSRNEIAVAHNAETINIDLTKLFMSFPPKDFRTFLLVFSKFNVDFNIIDKHIDHKSAFPFENTDNDLLNQFIGHYKNFNRKPKINMTNKEIYNDLQVLSNDLREWNFSITKCYHVIAILYCMGYKYHYLAYFASITRNEEFIGNIIYLFSRLTDSDIALDHLMKSKSYHSLNLITILLCIRHSNDFDFANLLFLSGSKYIFGLLCYMTLKSSRLLPYFYLNDLNKHKFLMDLIKQHISKAEKKLINYFKPKDSELKNVLVLFQNCLDTGQFSKAKEIMKAMIKTDGMNEYGYLQIYLALIKFGEGDLANGLINLEWAPKNHHFVQLRVGLFIFHGYRLTKSRSLGIEYIEASAVNDVYAKLEIAKLYLQGVYVVQNIGLALTYFSQTIDYGSSLSNEYIQKIKSGHYYFYVNSDLYVVTLVNELQLSDDFVPHYDGKIYFGVLEQSEAFYIRHIKSQNPLSMYCCAHMMDSVDLAIYWLEQSLQYELDIVYNELAYLYFIYKDDDAKSKCYAGIGAKLGFAESQQIFSTILLAENPLDTFWLGELPVSWRYHEFSYCYRFEQMEESSFFEFRAKIIEQAANGYNKKIQANDSLEITL